MKLLILLTTFSLFVMVGASTGFPISMDESMTESIRASNGMTAMMPSQMNCTTSVCQTNFMGNMSNGECLIHCIVAYSSLSGFNGAILPVGFIFVLLALAILNLFWPKMLELGSNFDKRRFSDPFNKLLLHRSLATVVIRD